MTFPLLFPSHRPFDPRRQTPSRETMTFGKTVCLFTSYFRRKGSFFPSQTNMCYIGQLPARHPPAVPCLKSGGRNQAGHPSLARTILVELPLLDMRFILIYLGAHDLKAYSKRCGRFLIPHLTSRPSYASCDARVDTS